LELSYVSDSLQAALAGAERVMELLDAEEAVGDAPNAIGVERFRGEVEFRDVWFSYSGQPDLEPESDRWALRGIDLRVEPGEAVALVGATGSGKTTFINLLGRLYDVQKGTVLIDGVDVRRYAQRELRQHIAVVPQEPFLFAGTIESNLRIRESTPREHAVAACREVGIHDFIQTLPKGYQTEIGEAGAKLSTGQKQLLSLARALAVGSDMWIVLDEATASVDSEWEELVQAALKRVIRGRTCLVIAHRLSTIRECERIVVMSHGRIIEDGSHAALVARGGHYAELVRLQFFAGHASPGVEPALAAS
jgi:ATP-binding cassette, subfamily B, multidrug efflux pump